MNDNVCSICPDCAKENGATWPVGHCATFWPAPCGVCGKDEVVCDVSDYNWPHDKRPKQWSLERRD